MGSILTNGVYLPDEGERNCYTGLAANWRALDAHLGNTDIHVTYADKQAWNGHVADTTIHVTSADKQAWNEHVADTVKHVTASDKQTWNGKQDALSQTQLDAVNSGIDSSKVQQIATNTSDISSLQSGKANDSDVVHKSGNETISGQKTFTNSLIVGNSDSSANTAQLWLKNSKVNRGQTVYGDQPIWFRDATDKPVTAIISRVSSFGASMLLLYAYNVNQNNNQVSNNLSFTKNLDGTCFLLPDQNDVVGLGSASAKWSDVQTSKINGLEPSSLSLPSNRSARIDISSYFTNTGTGQSNSYTVPANGYIYLTLSELTNIHCFSRTSGNVTNYAQTFTKPSNSTGVLYVLFPVRKNDVFVATWYTVTTVSVDGAYFIPCQGNV